MRAVSIAYIDEEPDTLQEIVRSKGRDKASSCLKKFSDKESMYLSKKRQRTQKQVNQAQQKSWKQVLKNIKKDKIVKGFINLLKINMLKTNTPIKDDFFVANMQNIEEKGFQYTNNEDHLQMNLFNLKYYYEVSTFIKILLTVGLFFFASVKIAFGNAPFQNRVLPYFYGFRLVSFFIQILTLVYTFNSKKQQHEFKIYFQKWFSKNKIYYDLLLFVTFFIDLFGISQINIISSILIFREIKIGILGLKRMQIYLANHFNFSQYWQMIKIILFNFAIAHCLSIVLNFIAQSNSSKAGWYEIKNLVGAGWSKQYIWGYYWGTTIMLTVGFGDIYATNEVEAISLVFVETFACIILAYNISEVSKIIQMINKVDQQKATKLGLFHNIGERNAINKDFKIVVEQYIEKSVSQKYECCYKDEEKIIEQLPEKLKIDIKKEINKNIFSGLYFFKELTTKTTQILAGRLVSVVAHPEQIILRQNQLWKIYILRVGSLAITYRRGNAKKNGSKIQSFSVTEKQEPKLISSKFTRNQNIPGDLRSFSYSIFNQLSVEELVTVLKQSNTIMFEYFCYIRDRSYEKYNVGTYVCQYCPQYKHDKFDCPRLHLYPLKHHVIMKSLKMQPRFGKQSRMKDSMTRLLLGHEPTLKNYHSLKSTIRSQKEITVKRFFVSQKKINFAALEQKEKIEQIKFNHGFDDLKYFNEEILKRVEKCDEKIGHIIGLLKRQQAEQIQTDAAANYKKYFPEFNSDELNSKIKKQKKLTKKLKSKEYF